MKLIDLGWGDGDKGFYLKAYVNREQGLTALKSFDVAKETDLQIALTKKKRSLDSNGYLWSLINELANVMRTSKDECYLEMLKRYGQSSMVSIISEAVEMFTRSIKYYELHGATELKGKQFQHIKVYVGSSEFDSREMAILLDGVISECQSLGIETMPPDEILRLKANWRGEK
ncbi:MAG: hypothetical protein WCL51_03780 [Bacteroidota bacterium]